MEAAKLNPISLTFDSKQLETRYRERMLPQMRIQTVFAVVLTLVLFLLFAFLDPWVVPEVQRQVWVMRIFVAVLCALIITLTFTPLFDRWNQLIIASLPILGGLTILAQVTIAAETGRQLYYAGLILAIIGTMLAVRLNFLYAVGICLGLIVGYEVVVAFLAPVPWHVALNNTFFLLGAMLMCGFAGYMLQRYDRLNFVQAMQIERERQRSESLLLNVLPAEITETLKRRHSDEVAPALVRNSTIAERFEQASILFADIIGFTNLSIQMSPEEMVHLLNETFSYFDSLMDTFGVEKIRTIGDNYMVAAGVPRPRPDHAQALAGVALMMRDHAGAAPLPGAPNFRFRIGINSGPVVAGIIGRKKFQYDIWGDIVNTASRMESQGVPGEIQITRATYELIKDEFICVPRGRLEVKGVGELETWLLRGRMNSEGAAQPAVR